MLNQQHFYWQLITKYITVFGKIFDDIYITRYDTNGIKIGDIKAPIQYSSVEYMISRVLSDPEIQRQDADILPRLSFELLGLEYVGDNKVSSLSRNTVQDPTSTNDLFYQYSPVPYNLNVMLYVYVKNIDDGNQIIEQILPFFTPDWTANIQLIESMDQTFKIPIVLKSIILDDMWDGDFKKRRALVWKLTFTIKALLFGPQYKKAIIKFSNTNLRVGNTSDNQLAASQQVVPALNYSNGSPVPVLEIPINSDFTYNFTTTDFIQ